MSFPTFEIKPVYGLILKIFDYLFLPTKQHGLLASGGGTMDKTIRFWNTLTGQPLHHVDTGSQVKHTFLVNPFKQYIFNPLSAGK